jgi:hypothetical protein
MYESDWTWLETADQALQTGSVAEVNKLRRPCEGVAEKFQAVGKHVRKRPVRGTVEAWRAEAG